MGEFEINVDPARKGEDKTVWIVTAGEYSDYRVIRAFSSEEKAQKFILEKKEEARNDCECMEIQEWRLDRDEDEKKYKQRISSAYVFKNWKYNKN